MLSQDFSCSECQKEFKSASGLLKHFALHAAHALGLKHDDKTQKKTKIPDLYPIKFDKKIQVKMEIDPELESDSGIEDVNPLKFCLVTMDSGVKSDVKISKSSTVRKYQCNYCLKRFGWSTDLKRHILTHTGEKPFPCQFCDLAFTRNFLLLKHQKKCHDFDAKRIPKLEPMSSSKSRKQEKSKIKRKLIFTDEFVHKHDLCCRH